MKKSINRGAYKRVSQAEGISIGATVYQNITTDPLFAAIVPKAEILKTRRDAYEVANAKAANGGSLLIEQKNNAYGLHIEQMDDIADDVEKLADGDISIAKAAGFPTVKEAESITDLPIPQGLVALNMTRSGAIKTSWKADPNAVNYAIETQVEGSDVWQNGRYSTNSRNNILTGFTPGVYLLVRIYSMGRKGLKSEPTEPVRVLVS